MEDKEQFKGDEQQWKGRGGELFSDEMIFERNGWLGPEERRLHIPLSKTLIPCPERSFIGNRMNYGLLCRVKLKSMVDRGIVIMPAPSRSTISNNKDNALAMTVLC